MRALVTIVMLVAASVATAPFAKRAGAFEFVGYSTPKPATGFGAMSEACRTEFPGQSRPCTSREYLLSPKIFPPKTSAWLLPEIVGTAGTDLVDFSGERQGKATLNCDSWTTNNASFLGLAVDSKGSVTVRLCSIVLPVTCCAR